MDVLESPVTVPLSTNTEQQWLILAHKWSLLLMTDHLTAQHKSSKEPLVGS